jgi:uncharacterized membrane protein YhaH (DUF805 family)
LTLAQRKKLYILKILENFMNFLEATKNYFIKWKDFNTRISRSEFWWGYLGSFIAAILVGIIVAVVYISVALSVNFPIEERGLDIAAAPFQIFFYIAGLSLTVRRLHDLNKSGWWFLIVFTIVGVFVIIYWQCLKGDEGDNRFGPDPLGTSTVESKDDQQLSA